MSESIKRLTPEDPGWAEAFAENSTPLRKKVEQIFEQASTEGNLDPQVEKAWKLAEDQEFLTHLLELEEPEQVQAAFAEKGVTLTLEDVKLMGRTIEKVLETGGELTEEDLEEVAGGSFVAFGGAATLATNVVTAGAGAMSLGAALTGVGIAIGIGIVVGVVVATNWRRIKSWFRRW